MRQQPTNHLPLTVMPGDRIFVNSLHAIGRNVLEDCLDVDADGSITVEEFLRQSGCFLDVTIPSSGGYVIGRAMIRQGIEHLGQELRGRAYSDRQARHLMQNADFLLYTKGEGLERIPLTLPSSLAAYVQSHIDAAAQAHRDQLVLARDRRHKAREKRSRRSLQ